VSSSKVEGSKVETRSEPAMRVETRGAERTLVAEIEIAAPPETVWKAITEGESIASWFAFQAASDPRPGGFIFLSWDGAWESRMTIDAIEPLRRLRHSWPVTAPGGEKVQLAVEYQLAGHGGSTKLRLVHSGFSSDESWDGIVDSHRRGWGFELGSLRHYTENHPGRRRGLIKVEAKVECGEQEAWRRMWSQEGWLARGSLSDVEAGNPYRVTTRGGQHLEGRVTFREAPTDLAATVDNLDRALLRFSIERWEAPQDELKARLWLFSWTMTDAERDRLQQSWQGELERVFAGGSGNGDEASS
jgi:uncharacterized protein YndB with AHSA1/START domain